MKRRGTSLILQAIEPSRQSVDAEELRYPHLRAALGSFSLSDYLRRSKGLLAKPHQIPSKGAIIRRELSTAYLLGASYRLQKAQTPVNKYFWSKQFTIASIGLFGSPEPSRVRSLAATELRYFEGIAAQLNDRHNFTQDLLSSYRRLAGKARPTRSLEQRFEPTLASIRDYLYKHYGRTLAVFDDIADEQVLVPNDIRRYFRRALTVLAESDSQWRQWRVVSDQTGGLAVDTERKLITIGRYRTPINVRDARGLLAHEVLVHANRSLNGYRLSNELGKGLEGYLEAEEGLGVLAEASITGFIPEKIKDRYIDVALAMGNYRRQPINRDQLFNISYVRSVLRSIERDVELDLDELEQATWQHVNRIYRGSLGDKYVGVFTKDIAYYQGFIKMARYLAARRRAKKFTSSMQTALSAKLDPSNATHRRRLRELTKE